MVKFEEIRNRKKRQMILKNCKVCQLACNSCCLKWNSKEPSDWMLHESCSSFSWRTVNWTRRVLSRGVERILYGIMHNCVCVCVRVCPCVEVKETLVMKNHTFQNFHRGHGHTNKLRVHLWVLKYHQSRDKNETHFHLNEILLLKYRHKDIQRHSNMWEWPHSIYV